MVDSPCHEAKEGPEGRKEKGTLPFMQKGTLYFMQKGTLANPLSNVRRCWLAMPPVAGFLSWVLACRKIEKKTKRPACKVTSC